jgi:serine/threonine protein phosphatase 1
MIVIGDMHGCLDTLLELKKQLPHDNLCFTGDLVDRGKNNFDTVQHIIDNDYQCVLGNHEEMMLISMGKIQTHYSRARDTYGVWMNNGGLETLSEYDNKPEEDLQKHLEFLNNLPLYIEYKNKYDEKFVVSHSTLKEVWHLRDSPKKSDKDTFRMHCLWSREFDSEFDKLEGIDYNVIGHTPRKYSYVKDKLVYVDTGCVFEQDLTAYDMETGRKFVQPFVGELTRKKDSVILK